MKGHFGFISVYSNDKNALEVLNLLGSIITCSNLSFEPTWNSAFMPLLAQSINTNSLRTVYFQGEIPDSVLELILSRCGHFSIYHESEKQESHGEKAKLDSDFKFEPSVDHLIRQLTSINPAYIKVKFEAQKHLNAENDYVVCSGLCPNDEGVVAQKTFLCFSGSSSEIHDSVFTRGPGLNISKARFEKGDFLKV
ncbi:hypothetical protein L596_016508 [Steinernema carpocapsae]|uniref:Uncharacterized protein n=1 Tax=Steinernema carpocapsae TaxID=34508 RepID=A0A4U5NJ80_STECR|nr:hypothetical protein L596_016508 [Steinernema carpocapsae]